MTHLPLKLRLSTGPELNSPWEVADYSPPKDAIDLVNFNDFLASGSYSLPDLQILEVNPCLPSPPKNFFLLEGTPTAKVKAQAAIETVEVDRFSVADSLKTSAQTANTTAPGSTYGSDSSSNLRKRNSQAEGIDKWLNKQILNDEVYSGTIKAKSKENNVFFNSVFGTDISTERIAKIAIRLIDHTSPILDQEWSLLTPLDRTTLAVYLAQVYGLKPQNPPDLNTPATLNQLLSFKLKGRRNEEKLNKTVKRVNNMIARSFADLNGLSDLDEFELAEILQAAYFGEASAEGNVFAPNAGFSQKSFGKTVETARYAEDFEAMLKSSYIAELLRSRHQKVLKEVKALRKNLQEGRDPQTQLEHNKRSPWLLEDIIDGAKLCQNIIDRKKIG